jgi:glycosyltransferase involved in cell wall biosynthesis
MNAIGEPASDERPKILVVCPKYFPVEEGLAHYTTEFSRHLARRFRVAVWTGTTSAGVDHRGHGVEVIANVEKWTFLRPFFAIGPALRFDPDRVLIQFVPFMYSPHGGINFTLVLMAAFFAARSRVRGRGAVEIMFHEVWFPAFRNPKALVMHVAHRAMAFGVSIVARQSFCSTYVSARLIKEQIRLFGRPVHVLFVGSNLERDVRPTPPRTTEALKVCIFGSTHPSKNVPLVLRTLHEAHRRAQSPFELTVIGLTLAELVHEAPELEAWLANDVRIEGMLSADAAADCLGEQDLAVCYFSDGVSGRRGSMLAALCEGTPIVTTARDYTDPEFYEQRAVTLLSCDEREFAAGLIALLAGPKRPFEGVSRAEVREFYDRYFSWTAIVERYAELSGLAQPAGARAGSERA